MAVVVYRSYNWGWTGAAGGVRLQPQGFPGGEGLGTAGWGKLGGKCCCSALAENGYVAEDKLF
jgi:hypothetical protein